MLLLSLPIRPDFVNEAVMKEEDWIVGRSHRLHRPTDPKMYSIVELGTGKFDTAVTTLSDPTFDSVPKSNRERTAVVVGSIVIANCNSLPPWNLFANGTPSGGYWPESKLASGWCMPNVHSTDLSRCSIT